MIHISKLLSRSVPCIFFLYKCGKLLRSWQGQRFFYGSSDAVYFMVIKIARKIAEIFFSATFRSQCKPAPCSTGLQSNKPGGFQGRRQSQNRCCRVGRTLQFALMLQSANKMDRFICNRTTVLCIIGLTILTGKYQMQPQTFYSLNKTKLVFP